jgi:hypothetical protein
MCECETLASLRHTHLGSFFLDPEDIRKLRIVAIWNFEKGTGFFNLVIGHGAPVSHLGFFRVGSSTNSVEDRG